MLPAVRWMGATTIVRVCEQVGSVTRLSVRVRVCASENVQVGKLCVYNRLAQLIDSSSAVVPSRAAICCCASTLHIAAATCVRLKS